MTMYVLLAVRVNFFSLYLDALYIILCLDMMSLGNLLRNMENHPKPDVVKEIQTILS